MLRAAVTALALGWAAAAGAQVTLSPEEMRAAAVAAVQAGDLAAADAFARALLGRDPGDATALQVQARIGLAAGDLAGARAAALALWRASGDAATRHEAARLIAWADVQAGHPLLAQLWLRRAMTVAPDREALRQTVADFRAVREASPLSLTFGLSVSPSDNATGGTTADVIEINGEPLYLGPFPLSPAPIDQAYSGISYAPSLHLTWRAARDETSATDLWFLLQGRGVILSDAAKAALEGDDYEGEQITARDFSHVQVLLGVDHRRAAPEGSHNWTGHIGRTWPRGEPGEDIVNIGYSRTYQLDEGQALVLGGSLEWRFDIADSAQDQWRQTLRAATVREIFDGRWQLRYDLTLTRSLSDHYGNAFDRVTAATTLTPDSFLPGIDLTLRASMMATRFPDYEFLEPVPGGRFDRQARLGVDLTFDRLSWAGFSPTMSVEAQRTDSNVNQFESDGISINFGLESTF